MKWLALLTSALLPCSAAPAATSAKRIELHHATGGLRSFTAVAVAADGTIAAAAGQNGYVLLWDVASGRELRRIVADATQLKFSPDGKWLVGVSQKGAIKVIDTRTGEFAGEGGDYRSDELGVRIFQDRLLIYVGAASHAFDPDKHILTEAREYLTGPQLDPIRMASAYWWADDRSEAAAGGAGAGPTDQPAAHFFVVLFDPIKGLRRQLFEGLTAKVTALAVSADDNHLAVSTSDGFLHMGDVDHSQNTKVSRSQYDTPIVVPYAEKGLFRSHFAVGVEMQWLSWGPKNATIRGISTDGKFLEVDAASGQVNRKFAVAATGPTTLGIAPDGKYVVTAEAGNPPVSRVTDTVSGKELGRLETPVERLDSLIASDDGKTVAVVSGNNMVIWNLAAGTVTHRLRMEEAPAVLAISPDGQYLFTGGKTTPPRLWNLSTGEAMPIDAGGAATLDAAFLKSRPELATSHAGKKMRFWNMSGTPVAPDADLPDDINIFGFSPDDDVVALASRDHVWIRYLATGTEDAELRGQADSNGTETPCWPVQQLRFTPEGASLVVTSQIATCLFDVATAKLTKRTENSDSKGRSSAAPLRRSAFTDNGRVLVELNSDDTLTLREVSAADPPGTIHWHNKAIRALAWSRNNDRVASASVDGKAAVIDMKQGGTVRELEGHSGGVNSLAISEDGNLTVTGGEDGTVRFWYTSKTPNVRDISLTAYGGVSALAGSADGKLMVSGQGKEGSLWKLPTLEKIATFKAGGLINVLAVSAGGGVLAGSSDGSAYLFDRTSGEPKKVLAHSKAVLAVGFSADGSRVITGSADKSAAVWNAASGEKIQDLPGTAIVTAVALTADGSAAIFGTANGDVMLRRLDATSTPEILFKHAKRVTAMAFSPGGNLLLSSGDDHQIQLYDLSSRALKWQQELSSSVTSIAFSPEGGRILAGLKKLGARILDSTTGDSIFQLGGSKDDIRSVAFAGSGRFAVLGENDRGSLLYEIETGLQSSIVVRSKKPIRAVALSSDGKIALAGGDEGVVRQIDTSTLNSRNILQPYPAGINAIAVTADGSRALLGMRDGRVEVRDLHTYGLVGTPVTHRGIVTSVALDKEGEWAASGGEDLVARAWKVGDSRAPFEMHHDAKVRCVAVSDTKLVASASDDGTVRIWQPENGQSVRWLRLKNPTAVAFAKNSDYVLVSDDKTLRVAPTDTGQQKNILDGHLSSISSAVFAPDGKTAWSAGADEKVIRWSVDTAAILSTDSVGHVKGVRFSADGRWAVGADGRALILWPVDDFGKARRFGLRGGSLEQAISSDGSLLAAVADRNHSRFITALTWGTLGMSEVVTGDLKVKPEELTIFRARDGGRVCSADYQWGDRGTFGSRFFMGDARRKDSWMRFDPAGDKLYVKAAGEFRIYSAKTCKEVEGEAAPDTETMAFSPRGTLLATLGAGGLYLRDRKTSVRRVLPALRATTAIGFSPDDSILVAGDSRGRISAWSTSDLRQIQRFIGHEGAVTTISVSPQMIALTGGVDGSLRTWNLQGQQVTSRLVNKPSSVSWLTDSLAQRLRATNEDLNVWDPDRPLATLMSFSDGSWIAISQDGRFDTNHVESNAGAQWIVDDDPFHPLPLDLYMRDYYEPELVPRMIAGSQFRPLRPAEDLNRMRPAVRIGAIEPDSQPDTLRITVQAQVTQNSPPTGGDGQSTENDVFDLRLFRDGHLVGLAKPEGFAADDVPETESPLQVWRRLTRMDKNNDVATSEFHVRLPRTGTGNAVRFTAYAFNGDRVKSETARCDYRPPLASAVQPGKAYILTIGVGANQQNDLSLLRAAADARLLIQELTPQLRRNFGEVVAIPLIASAAPNDEQDNELPPLKANIQAVLGALAGTSPELKLTGSAESRSGGVVRRIEPEDLLIITVAAHGNVQSGRFTFSALDGNVSAGELARWLSAIDGGQILLVLDTCYAGAALGSSFKPAPLGDPTLGQLSFDKGMLVLVSTTPDETATAPLSLQHSLLMQALVVEGLEQEKALDQSGHFDLRTWLRYAVERVPHLKFDDDADRPPETPKLLDFTLGKDDTLQTTQSCDIQFRAEGK